MSLDTPFVDIHCHLLPGVDDGATDLDMSLELIEQGLVDGIGTWLVTPHVLEEFDEETDQRLCAAYDRLREAVVRRALPAELAMGSEIMFQTNVAAVKARRAATFDGNGKYLLMEFPMGFVPGHADEVLFDFQRAGITPVIAHPERNAALAEHPRTIAQMVDRGLLMQVNARSLDENAPPPVRRLAEYLVRHGLAHFVASDAHHPQARPARLRTSWERICEIADEPTANLLCIENPRAAIAGERVRAPSYRPHVKMPWWLRLLERLS